MLPALLNLQDNESIQALRRQLSEADCVFDFAVLDVAPQASIDLDLHRQALGALYLQIEDQRREARRRLIQEHPRYADLGEAPPMRWEVQRAVARELDAQEIQRLGTASVLPGPQALYQAFIDPPYRTRFPEDGEPPEAIFQRWLALLGLEPEARPVVIDWVSDLQLEWEVEGTAATEAWSDYFDEGLEWWGVWCLSIWNPERRTLGVLMASATD